MALSDFENKFNSFDFLLIEYQRLQQLHFGEKKDEEQRVNFFITLTSVAGAGVTFLFQHNNGAVNYIIIQSVILLLIIIGLNTLGRIAITTIQALVISDLRNKIKDIFKNNSVEIKEYVDEQNKLLK